MENTIYHGIEPSSSGGTVEIGARFDGARVEITVSNPVNTSGDSKHRGHRLALDNVEQRLKAHFGKAAEAHSQRDAERYQVRLLVPVRA